MSDHGLLTTVAYKLGRDKPACYALEVQYLEQACTATRPIPFLMYRVMIQLLSPGRALWPSQELWCVGCRTILESSDHLKSLVRVQSYSTVGTFVCNYRHSLTHNSFLFCYYYLILFRKVGCICRYVLRLLFCSCLFGSLRALLGAERERVRARANTAVCETLTLKRYSLIHGLNLSVFQDHLWFNSVYQQEAPGICCAGSRLFPDTRGQHSTPLPTL